LTIICPCGQLWIRFVYLAFLKKEFVIRNFVMICVMLAVVLGLFLQEGEGQEKKGGDVTINWNNGMALKYYVGAKVERRPNDSRLWIIERGKAKYTAGDTFFVIVEDINIPAGNKIEIRIVDQTNVVVLKMNSKTEGRRLGWVYFPVKTKVHADYTLDFYLNGRKLPVSIMVEVEARPIILRPGEPFSFGS